MIIAAVSAAMITPTAKLATKLGTMSLETAVPKQFGDWDVDDKQLPIVVSREQQEMLSRIYSQVLSRTYVNKRSGEAVMLSIAYGDDQRDTIQLHYPEICYPAQGFEMISRQVGTINRIPGVILPVVRLVMTKGTQRIEPITYWAMIGERPTVGRWQKKMAEMDYGFKGLIADGLLFRVSSINADTQTAYKAQERFLSDLSEVIDPKMRGRFFGTQGAVDAAY
jgi:EpsI family protein